MASHGLLPTMKMTVLQRFPETEHYSGGPSRGCLSVVLSAAKEDLSSFAQDC